MREVTITLRSDVTCQLSESVVPPQLRNVVNNVAANGKRPIDKRSIQIDDRISCPRIEGFSLRRPAFVEIVRNLIHVPAVADDNALSRQRVRLEGGEHEGNFRDVLDQGELPVDGFA